jgi:hypothetical protein
VHIPGVPEHSLCAHTLQADEEGEKEVLKHALKKNRKQLSGDHS